MKNLRQHGVALTHKLRHQSRTAAKGGAGGNTVLDPSTGQRQRPPKRCPLSRPQTSPFTHMCWQPESIMRRSELKTMRIKELENKDPDELKAALDALDAMGKMKPKHRRQMGVEALPFPHPPSGQDCQAARSMFNHPPPCTVHILLALPHPSFHLPEREASGASSGEGDNPSRGPPEYIDKSVAAYAASRMPSTYAAVLRILTELRAVSPEDFAPASILDYGAGPGTAGGALVPRASQRGGAVCLADLRPVVMRVQGESRGLQWQWKGRGDVHFTARVCCTCSMGGLRCLGGSGARGRCC